MTALVHQLDPQARLVRAIRRGRQRLAPRRDWLPVEHVAHVKHIAPFMCYATKMSFITSKGTSYVHRQ